MPDPKMKKCRFCGKDVAVSDEENFEFVHDCGWSESKARAEVKRRRLLKQVEDEIEGAEKGKDKGKGIFGW